MMGRGIAAALALSSLLACDARRAVTLIVIDAGMPVPRSSHLRVDI
jgi:hypothetical protein